MRKTWKRLTSLALALVMLCGMITLPPAAFAAEDTPRADTVNSAVNGHRDIFSSTAVGQMPAGFETSRKIEVTLQPNGGTWKNVSEGADATADQVIAFDEGWSVIQGRNIDNWNGITVLNPAGSGISKPRNEVWNHFLRREGGAAIAVYENVYTDFDFTTHMMIPAGATTGAVVFRYQDDQNYYYYKLTVGSGATLGKVVGGVDTTLGTNARTVVENDTWYNLRVTMTGNQIVTKINNNPYYIDLVATTPAQSGIAGTQTFSVTDASLASGKVGYWSEGEGDASAQYCVFAVSNTAADLTLENNTLKVTTGPYGQIKELYLKSDNNTNFVSNEETHREDVGENHFLGELTFTYEVGGQRYTASTGASDDIRTITKQDNKVIVSYTAASQEAEGLRHFTVVETYTLESDHLQFDIEIKNSGSEELTILDLGMPMMWNNHWQFQSPYTEYASATGYYVSYNGSWLQIESAGGGAETKDGGQKLLFLPDSSTNAKFEYRRYYSNEQSFGMAPETFYVYSKAISSEGQGYLESTSRTLAAGETDNLSFRLYATDSYLDTEQTIYEAGSLDVQVNPGLVIPDDITALVDIHTKKEVNKVELITQGKTATVTAPTSTSGDHKVYSIKFNNQGRNDVKITYDGDKQSVLQFWVTDSVNEAMQAHVDFLMNTLRITEDDNPHKYSFGEYNNVTGAVDKTNVGTNHCSNNDYEQMYDGPAFIAEKNVYYPVQTEITAMDQYLIDLVFAKQVIHDEDAGDLYGRLYHGCCNAGNGSGCWGDQWPVEYYNGHILCKRVYNPVRIYNTFYSMYKAASYYGDSFAFRWEPSEYLYWAGVIATKSEQLSGTTGLMGEQTVPDIIEALRSEGMDDVADQLYAAASAKGQRVAAQAFPFGSEFSVDRTGEEGAYFLSKLVGSEASQVKAINKIMAWISKTPTWYQQTTGRTNDSDWWIFQYTVSLQAAALKDWYFDHADAQAYWSMIYPSAFSSFAHIKTSEDQESNGPTGTVWWNYWPTRPYDWSWGWPVNQTGEADIDLWGGMQLLSTDVVLHDPSFGLTAYGGVAKEEGGAIVVTPQDGLYTNLNVVGAGAEIELQSDKYTRAELTVENDQLTSLVLSLNNFRRTAHGANMTVSGLKPGAYQLTVNGVRQMIVNVSADSAAAFTYQVGADETAQLKIEPYAGHEGNLRAALIGDEALAGKGTSDWAVKGMASQLKTLLEGQNYDVQTFLDSSDNTGITTFDPDVVILMTESAADYAALIGTYQNLNLKPIVYAVTTGNETAAEAIRTAAGEKNAVLIDAWDLIGDRPDLAQDGALNNNGVRELAGVIYTRVTNQHYTAPAVERTPYEGVDAVDFDRQSGAHYRDAKESSGSASAPYVHVDANGYIGFEGLELDKFTDGLRVNAKFDASGILKVYTGNPADGGRLVGQVNATNTDWADITGDLLELTGTANLYLTATTGMDLKTVTLTETTTPAYRHDFTYNDNRWDAWSDSTWYPDGIGTQTEQQVYWIDDNYLGLIKNLSVENFRYEFDYQLYDGEQTGGIVFRVTESESWNPTGLAVLFDAASNKILVASMPGKETIQAFDYDLKSHVYRDFQHLSVLVYGNTVEVYGNDGALVGKVTDEKIAAGAGRAGVWSDGESIDFKNINIRGLVSGAPMIMAGPAGVSAHETETASFTVVAQGYSAGDTLTYQWQKSENQVIWEDISGATQATYTTGALAMEDDGTYYRVVVTANGTSTASTAAKLTVEHKAVVTAVTVSPETATVNLGGSRAFTAAVTGQYGPSEEVTWTVTGGTDEGTYIREDGALFVSEMESAGATLTVTATSDFDSTKSGSATVTLTPAVTKDDVVLHYIFDEGSGNTVTDYSKNGYHATITGNTTTSWSEDGYKFDGKSYLTPGSSAKLVSSDMTLVYKIKRTGNISLAASLFWGMPKSSWNGSGMWLNISGSTPLYVATNGAKNYSVQSDEYPSINDFYMQNQWVEVAVSVNAAGDLAIYRNGELVGSETEMLVTPPASGYNTIGMAGYDNEFLNNVIMGEYIIFNKALSEAEVKAVYADKFKPDTSGVVHEPKYTGITIAPTAVSVRPGGETTFTSEVTGTFLPADAQEVTWELTGNTSEATTLVNGKLTVAADEPAGTLKVKVTSVKAPELSAEATVTVVPKNPATAENIVLSYDFAGGSGDVVADKSGKGNDGTITGNSEDAWTADGYAFDGTQDIVPMHDGSNAQLLSPCMTVVMKVKRTGEFDYNSDGESFFWFKSAWGANGLYAQALPGGESPFHVQADTFGDFETVGYTVETFYPLNEEVEVVLTIDSLSGEYAIYRNGQKVETTQAGIPVTVTPVDGVTNYISKNSYGNNRLNGITMSKFMVLDAALTAEEVQAVYNGTFDSATTETASDVNADEAGGAGADEASGVNTDETAVRTVEVYKPGKKYYAARTLENSKTIDLSDARFAITREGYTFTGWKDENGKDYSSSDVITVAGDMTLTAQWQADPNFITGITVKTANGEAVNENTVLKVYTNNDHAGHAHNHSLTLTAQVEPENASNKNVNWTRSEVTGKVTLSRSGSQLTITAVHDEAETNVGPVELEIAAEGNPEVKKTITVQVIRMLENNVSISIQGVNEPNAAPKFGQTLEADINQLKMTDAGKAALRYQWKRNGSAISGANAKTYALTENDIGVKISVDVTADETTYYEGTRSAERSQAVVKADGPNVPGSTIYGVKTTTETNDDGKIVGFGDEYARYEYTVKDADAWVAVEAAEVTGLENGDYQVRIKETGTHEAGPAINVTVPAYDTNYKKVSIAAGLANGTITRDHPQADPGTTITLTVKPDTGYALDTITVTGASGNVTVSGEGNTRTFILPSEDVTVSATFKKIMLTVTHQLEHLKCSLGTNDSHQVEYGDTTAITLVPDEGYALPAGEAIEIANANGDKIAGWTINDQGVITITGGVTSDLTIKASGIVKTYVVNYTLTNGLSAPEANAPRRVAHKAAYTGKLVAASGYTLPTSITVTMGGEPFADSDFTYENGTLSIAAGKITGNLVVTAAGSSSSSPVTPSTPSVPSTPSTTTKVEKNEDGSTTTTVTDRKTGTVTATTEKADGTKEIVETRKDGTVTQTVEKTDGTKQIVETRKDGTVTQTVEKTDGSKQIVETRKDGTITETKVDSEGAKAEKVTDPEKNTEIKVTDATGEVVAEVKLPAEVPAPEKRFEDVPEDHWADEAIHEMAGLGVVNGVGSNRFDMNSGIKRGDLALMLARMSNAETTDYTASFTDVPAGKYYAGGVAWAAKTGVVRGRSVEVFDPEATITREELAAMLYRYAKLLKLDTSASTDELNAFTDGDKVSDWAAEAMSWCIKTGLVRGRGDNTLDPRSNITRAEVAVMIQRFVALMK